MLPDSIPTRKVAQAPAKETACYGGCGATVMFRTNPKVCCAECKSRRHLERSRRSSEAARRGRGIARVKGTQMDCGRCFKPFMRLGVAAKFCPSCRPAHVLDVAREASKRKAATPSGKAYATEYCRRKRACDPSYRVSAHMRVMIHRAIGAQKAGRSWRDFVPYTLAELMHHLERQFLPGMTWDNKGQWHIDHIRPVSSFHFKSPKDPEFREAWSLANLRPLWGQDNIRKQAKRTHLI